MSEHRRAGSQLPDVHAVPFNSHSLQIVFMMEDKDVPLVRALFDWGGGDP